MNLATLIRTAIIQLNQLPAVTAVVIQQWILCTQTTILRIKTIITIFLQIKVCLLEIE